jgi:AraC family transcriptional regulator
MPLGQAGPTTYAANKACSILVQSIDTRCGMKFEAEVNERPAIHVACMRHIGAYPEIGEALERLFQWARPKGLLDFSKTHSLGIYYDDPEEVDHEKLRSDACITVTETKRLDRNVNLVKIPGGLFAVAHVEIDHSEYGEAWDKLVKEWIPANGLISDSKRLCYEVYLNDPNKHPEGKHIVDIYEPVLRK